MTPPASASGDSGLPIISANGRYVIFASAANNLVVNNRSNPLPVLFPARLNVFVRDRLNGTTALASFNLTGTAGGNGDSLPAGVSADGRYTLFESSASDLVAEDTNNVNDVFVRDLVDNITFLVSTNPAGGCGNGVSRGSVMTPDGRYVAFASAATNLVADDTNRISDVFVRDLVAGTTTLVSVGAVSNLSLFLGGSEAPQITPDGRYVVFCSSATNLVPGVTTTGEVYVRDLVGGVTTCVSTNAHAFYPASTVISCNAYISADGNFVAFETCTNRPTQNSARGTIFRYNLTTGATNIIHANATVPLVPFENLHTLDMTPDGKFIAFVANVGAFDPSGRTNAIFLWDSQTGTNKLVSHALPMGAICGSPVVNSNGQYVAFLSATNLNATLAFHFYLRDMLAAAPVPVDVGPGADVSAVPALSADGRFVAFDYADGSLVANDSNHAVDVFARDVVMGTNELISVHDPGLPGNGPTLNWPGAFGDDYRVQFKTSLNDTNWQSVIGTTLFIGHRGYLTDLVPAADQRFYRVVSP